MLIAAVAPALAVASLLRGKAVLRYASPAAAAVFLIALVAVVAMTGGIAPLVRF